MDEEYKKHGYAKFRKQIYQESRAAVETPYWMKQKEKKQEKEKQLKEAIKKAVQKAEKELTDIFSKLEIKDTETKDKE